jgi:hypothetical protein
VLCFSKVSGFASRNRIREDFPMRFINALPSSLTMTVICLAQSEKPRVYVSDSNSWQTSGGFYASRGTASGSFSGGARPQTVEVIKTFGQRCPGVLVTMDKSKADYIILFDREGGKGVVLKHDKIAVFKKDGDVLYSGSTRSVGNAVQDSCGAIENQTFNNGPTASRPHTESTPSEAIVPKATEFAAQAPAPFSSAKQRGITIRFKSTPSNAEVDIDGVYWGTTPTADLTRLPAGTHAIILRKAGYERWERKIDLEIGDDRTVQAELDIDNAKARVSGLN